MSQSGVQAYYEPPTIVNNSVYLYVHMVGYYELDEAELCIGSREFEE